VKPSSHSHTWQLALEVALGLKLIAKQPVSGGDFAMAYAADLSDGSRVFVKTHSDPPPYFFTTEATGLSLLHASATVPIPQVLAVSDDPPFLALDWIDVGSTSSIKKRADEKLGAALADLHKIDQAAFGRQDLRCTGSLAVPNTPLKSYPEFYATQRLQPLVDMARKRGALPASDCDALIEIADNLAQADIADDQPSLLHGDLWAGNRIVDASGVSWLVDPAMHRGHREFDLSMMLLFGGYSEWCFEAYNEAYPLLPGFEQRVPLHQLAPLVVHAIKFGGSYQRSVASAIAATRQLLKC